VGYTLGQAARAAEVSKTTIQRAIKSGRLSASRQEDGSYVIDPAELHRAFPGVSRDGDSDGEMKQFVTVNAMGELRIAIGMLREQLAMLKDERDDLRAERDRLLGIVETQAPLVKPRDELLLKKHLQTQQLGAHPPCAPLYRKRTHYL
jgi:hypothetical protein